ncbi:MAG: hypothetical protein H7A23_03010 [Leptospiraceae bacterium]|nr:hypothetical protein [Leptospiraceae bacterium]
MAYSNFTFAKLKKDYNIEQKDVFLFNNIAIEHKEASQRLKDDLQEAKEIPLMTEKAKSEAIIYPIIKEIRRKNPQIGIFSGYALNIEGNKDLQGNPDFMISAKAQKSSVEAPIFCMVEAKNGVIEEGYAQCAAEMYAARLFNQDMNEPYETIYGAVTNAFDWVFLKLENKIVLIDRERYFLNDLPKILGIFQYIVDSIHAQQLA